MREHAYHVASLLGGGVDAEQFLQNGSVATANKNAPLEMDEDMADEVRDYIERINEAGKFVMPE